MFFRESFFFLTGIIFLAAFLIIAGCKAETDPAGIIKPVLYDMEFLKYAYYNGGVINSYEYVVYHLTDDGKTLIEYDQWSDDWSNTMLKIKKNSSFFEGLTNINQFDCIYTYDLQRGTLIHAVEDWYDDTNSGPCDAYNEVNFDYDRNLVFCRVKNWDGRKIDTRISRYKLRTGYSYFYNNTIYTQILFFNYKKPGIVYAVAPEYIKEPQEVTFVPAGNEYISTPLGKFFTTVMRAVPSDPFISSLTENIANHWHIFTVKFPAGLMIKAEDPFKGLMDLIYKGTWTNKSNFKSGIK